MKLLFTILLLIYFVSFFSCGSKTTKRSVDQDDLVPQTSGIPEEVFFATDKGKILTVQVAEENVRAYPNGRKLGKLRRGSQVTVKKRAGNWILFENRQFPDAYIWAPSVGYAYQNLYSQAFYFNPDKNRFHDIIYFQRIFSQKGQRREVLTSSYELFFKDTGLGSHDETIIDGGAVSQQSIEHGITFFVDKKTQEIRKIRVDYFRPVKGYENALKKSGLPVKAPIEMNSGHLIWPPGELLEKIMVDLERQAWDSQWFSSVWFILRKE